VSRNGPFTFSMSMRPFRTILKVLVEQGPANLSGVNSPEFHLRLALPEQFSRSEPLASAWPKISRRTGPLRMARSAPIGEDGAGGDLSESGACQCLGFAS
jgi:hypothetical protein